MYYFKVNDVEKEKKKPVPTNQILVQINAILPTKKRSIKRSRVEIRLKSRSIVSVCSSTLLCKVYLSPNILVSLYIEEKIEETYT